MTLHEHGDDLVHGTQREVDPLRIDEGPIKIRHRMVRDADPKIPELVDDRFTGDVELAGGEPIPVVPQQGEEKIHRPDGSRPESVREAFGSAPCAVPGRIRSAARLLLGVAGLRPIPFDPLDVVRLERIATEPRELKGPSCRVVRRRMQDGDDPMLGADPVVTEPPSDLEDVTLDRAPPHQAMLRRDRARALELRVHRLGEPRAGPLGIGPYRLEL